MKRLFSNFPPGLAMLVGILAVSTASILIRYAQREVPSLVIAFYRLAFSTLFILPWAATSHRQEILSLPKKKLLLAVISGVFLAFHFATWITSLEYTTVASSVVWVSTSPVWVAVLAPVFLKERLSKTALGGILLALLGGVVIAFNDTCALVENQVSCPDMTSIFSANPMIGNGLALLGAVFVAGYYIIGKNLRQTTSLITYVFIVYGAASLTLLIWIAIAGLPLSGYSLLAYVLFIGLAIGPQLLGHTSFNYAVRYFPVAVVSVTLLAEPIGSTILAYFLLNETPSVIKLIGGGIILAGIYIVSLYQPRE